MLEFLIKLVKMAGFQTRSRAALIIARLAWFNRVSSRFVTATWKRQQFVVVAGSGFQGE